MTSPPDLSGFGTATILHLLTGGFRNEVWKVEIDGKLYVAKSTRRSEAQVNWMTGLMSLAARAGFRTPQLHRSANGTYISGGFTLESYLSGHLCAEGNMPDISRALTAFHQASRALPQRPGFASCADLLTKDVGGDVDMRALPDDLRQKIRRAFAAIADQPVVPVHGDLGEINVLIADGLPPALIDWDESRVDCAFFDLQRLPGVTLSAAEEKASLAFEIATCWQSEAEYSQNLARKLT
ncbi:phosphotransferase enzyme family protein [Halocynthiibacter styelae]|uniref:Phosphotransferase n=1 Tax=Halocynthiibacter styelae TaxID=2761955 RepID=A0A8J7ID24_9RHOB|nr:phosphotransferase [Paenihalocynthiibacter styelae]MBI1492072.1 phosphotransferase [Paenihalocynthiibacter styelae]